MENLAEVPSGAVTIFSAHGVATAMVDEASRRKLEIIDATCPLVTKVHLQAQRYSLRGFEVVIIGHPGHPEVEGTRGRVTGPVHVISEREDVDQLDIKDPQRIAYVTQTTLSVDDTRDVIETLRRRFPAIQGPDLDGICYATQNRQNAVRDLADQVDLLLVVGARNSSNSNRLREVGQQAGLSAYLVQDASEIKQEWFKPGIRVVQSVREMDAEPETTTFRIPVVLSNKITQVKQNQVG